MNAGKSCVAERTKLGRICCSICLSTHRRRQKDRLPGSLRGPPSHLAPREFLLCALGAALLAFCLPCGAITIVSGPSFTKATNAPLAGVLRFTTDTESRVSVSASDGKDTWRRDFYDYARMHAVPLFGFKPGRTNWITVTARDRSRNEVVAAEPVVFITDAVPADFPNIALLKSQPGRMEPGYTLFRVGVHNETYWYIVIVDSAGEVVWYNVGPSTADVRQLPNGNLFMPWKTNFAEMDLLGQAINSWVVPTNLPVNVHEGLPTGHGTILYLSDALKSVSNFPTSVTDSNAPTATANVLYQRVVEISAADATVLNTWSPINVLDPKRVSSYLFNTWEGGWDVEHSNAIIEDPRDDSLLVSMRLQNAVIKFSRATGQLKWILGPHENWGPAWQPCLLKPVGAPFAWQYAQHAPVLMPQGTFLLYDNGNYRASPFSPPVPDKDNYTRVVEYSINEQTMEISQVWDYGRTNVTDRIFTDHEGNAEPEPKTGNILIDFSAVSYVNGSPPSQYGPDATMVRITEVTHEAMPEVVFDLAITMYDKPNALYRDCSVYRCHRIADLYAHPAQAVADLTVSFRNGLPLLQFSADDTRTYHVQASSNLLDWVTLGTPSEDQQKTGEFDFEDRTSSQLPLRYYRVLTE